MIDVERPLLTELRQYLADRIGWCTHCRQRVPGTDPDAMHVECPACCWDTLQGAAYLLGKRHYVDDTTVVPTVDYPSLEQED